MKAVILTLPFFAFCSIETFLLVGNREHPPVLCFVLFGAAAVALVFKGANDLPGAVITATAAALLGLPVGLRPAGGRKAARHLAATRPLASSLFAAAGVLSGTQRAGDPAYCADFQPTAPPP